MNHETIRQSPFVFRSVNMVWFKCQTMAGAPAGGTDGLYSEQRECEERVFFPFLGPTPHLSRPPSVTSGETESRIHQAGSPSRVGFKVGYQGLEKPQ